MGGYLLVARRHHRDAVARIIERVEQPDIAVAANAEHVGNLIGDQILGDQVGTLHPRHDFPVSFEAGRELPVPSGNLFRA